MTGRTMSAAGYEIDRASAGNVKFSNAEKAADTEQEDEFGYTASNIHLSTSAGTLRIIPVLYFRENKEEVWSSWQSY